MLRCSRVALFARAAGCTWRWLHVTLFARCAVHALLCPEHCSHLVLLALCAVSALPSLRIALFMRYDIRALHYLRVAPFVRCAVYTLKLSPVALLARYAVHALATPAALRMFHCACCFTFAARIASRLLRCARNSKLVALYALVVAFYDVRAP